MIPQQQESLRPLRNEDRNRPIDIRNTSRNEITGNPFLVNKQEKRKAPFLPSFAIGSFTIPGSSRGPLNSEREKLFTRMACWIPLYPIYLYIRKKPSLFYFIDRQFEGGFTETKIRPACWS